MFVLIDNYDSFTYNLWHYLEELGASTKVIRNDAVTIEDLSHNEWEGIILSPGPSTPDEAGLCLDVIKKFSPRHPILGVCLGHQAIGQSFGGKVIRAPQPVHGKTSSIHHHGQGLFTKIPTPFQGTRYHSLIVEKETLPSCFTVSAWSDDGLIMGLEHKDYNVHSVQFHPESIASEHGKVLINNFITLAKKLKK